MRTLVFTIAVMVLVPMSALAQVHGAATDVYIDGDLSIGRASAVRNLSVYTSAALPAGSSWQNTVTGTATGDGFYFGIDSSGIAYLYQFENLDLILGTNSTARMTVKSNGRVGIGISNPSRNLSVYSSGSTATGSSWQNGATGTGGSDGFYFGIGSVGQAYLYNYENQDIIVGTNSAVRMTIKNNGRVGIGTAAPATLLDVDGEATVNVLNVAGADMAEMFDVRAEESVPGMIVSIDAEHAGGLVLSSRAYDKAVAGIIAGAGDLEPGMLLGKDGTSEEGSHPVSLSGRAYCYVDATKAPVQPGDLLTTSDVPGHAMKVIDFGKAQGAIIGKAMTPLKGGRGLVMVLVCLQ